MGKVLYFLQSMVSYNMNDNINILVIKILLMLFLAIGNFKLSPSYALSPKSAIKEELIKFDSDYLVKKFLKDKKVLINIDDNYEIRFTYRYVSKKNHVNVFQEMFSIYAEYRKIIEGRLLEFEKIGQIDVDVDTINYAFTREKRFTKPGEKKYVSRYEALPSISVKSEISQKFSGIGKTLMILSMEYVKNKGFKNFKVEEPVGSAKRFYTKVLGFKKDLNNKENKGLIFDLHKQDIPKISIKMKTPSVGKRILRYFLKFV